MLAVWVQLGALCFVCDAVVSNPDEMILASLLTGLSFRDLYNMAQQGIEGLPRDVTIKTLNNFEHRYGRTPDIIQMALPNLAGNTKGYMAPAVEMVRAGQRVEMDF